MFVRNIQAFTSIIPISNPFIQSHQQSKSYSSPRCTTSSPSTSTISPPPILQPSDESKWDNAYVSNPQIYRYDSPEGSQYAMWYIGRSNDKQWSEKIPSGMYSGSIGLALSTDGLHFEKQEKQVLTPNHEQWWAFDTAHISALSMFSGTSPIVRTDSSYFQLFYSAGDDELVESFIEKPVPGLRMRIGIALSKDGEHFSRYEGQFPSGAVLDVGQPGHFDEYFVTAPNVIYIPEKEQYLMHYTSCDASSLRFHVGRAVSKDGFNFEREITDPINFPSSSNNPSDFDAGGHSRTCVVRREDGMYIMFVETTSKDRIHSICMTESKDAREWGPLQQILTPGPPGSWDDGGVSHPEAIILQDGTLRLYYTGKNTDKHQKVCIGVVQSNGTDWSYLARLSAPSA